MNKLYKISPSDLTFLYDGCQRCFYFKIVHGISQPSIPIPGVFSKIASLLKTHYTGARTEKVCKDLEPGTVTYGEKWVKSIPVKLPNHRSSFYIAGRFDIVVEFDKNGYGVLDFKTGNPKDEINNPYSRQLHAYSFALENPAEGALHLKPVIKLGLLYFPPTRTAQRDGDIERLFYECSVNWVAIKRDDDYFFEFMDDVMTLLESINPPDPSSECSWCNYVNKVYALSRFSEISPEKDIPF